MDQPGLSCAEVRIHAVEHRQRDHLGRFCVEGEIVAQDDPGLGPVVASYMGQRADLTGSKCDNFGHIAPDTASPSPRLNVPADIAVEAVREVLNTRNFRCGGRFR